MLAGDEAVADEGAEAVDHGSATALYDPGQDLGTSLVPFLYPVLELTCHGHLNDLLNLRRLNIE